MPVHNADIEKIFNHIADLLDIEGANQFRVRAYRNAARTVAGHAHSLADMVQKGEDLTQLSGIGQDLAQKIDEIVQTGTLSMLKDLKERVPSALSDLMHVAGLGPKRVKTLHQELDVSSLEDLKKVAEQGKIKQLSGFGPKMEQKILDSVGKTQAHEKRILLSEAQQFGLPLENFLKSVEGVKDAIIAGSYRRKKETVGDLDILVTCSEDSPVMDKFTSYEDVQEVVSQGSTRSTVILRSGLQVDLRVVAEKSYGAALHYFTGSKAHNIAVRKLSLDKDLKINEYGVFKGEQSIAGQTEEEVYATVGLTYIEPELRENRGEIEAAQENRLPELVKAEDIKGDLHAHSKATDGHNTLEEMGQAAKERGYDYLAITDHSQRLRMVKGLDKKRLRQQIQEIDELNKKLAPFVLLKSIEVDILEDGSLDLPNEVLNELDLVICSIHHKFNLTKKKQTERILKAMDNPCFNVLGHPTGRLIGSREAYELDMESILQDAKDKGCFMELNAQPERLDLNDVHCMRAKELGVKVVISTDAHSTGQLDLMEMGLGQARRGWLRAQDVLNTQSLAGLKKVLKR